MVHLNFPGRLWTEHHSFAVRCGNAISTSHPAEEGLPKGSALSLLLFNIFVHDIPTFEKDRFVHLLQFVDDTALIGSGRNIDSAQTIVETAFQSIPIWRISLNRNKTEVILFGKRIPKRNYIKVADTTVIMKKSVTYLGITFDRALSFSTHTKRRKGLAETSLRCLCHLTKPDSLLNLANRLRISKNVALPMATYGEEVWINGSPLKRCRLPTQ